MRTMNAIWFSLDVGEASCSDAGRRRYRVDHSSMQHLTALYVAPLNQQRAELHRMLDAAIDKIDADIRFAGK